MNSLQNELKFLSELLQNHPRLIVIGTEDYFRIEVKTSRSSIFSVEIPKEYPYSDLIWHKPFLPKQLNITDGQYKHSMLPLSAGIYEILTYYSNQLGFQLHISELKRYLDRQETELVPSSPILPCSIFESFEELSDSNSIGDSFEVIERLPCNIESIDNPSCSDTEGSDGYDSDCTVTGEDEAILDSVMSLEPQVQSKPLISVSMLESFGMNTEAARAMSSSCNSCLSDLRICTELSYIKESGMYNGPGDSLHLRLLGDSIYKWELKIWEFPEPCHLNTELLKYCPTDKCVTLEITFSQNYPFVPPFLRVVSPPIRAGHIIMGGALFLDVLLPKSCKLLGSPRAYSVSIQMNDLFIQLIYSMVDGNAHVMDSPSLSQTYTYEKAYFVYNCIIGLATVDWENIIRNVMEPGDRLQLDSSVTPSTRFDLGNW
ncbi:Ubiquitin-conjugating enzyme [Oopsacas minuta]|uniref:Ubiquitin-conjugating enzyme n=1 Tax=Oopsacas minuta TaxID=111878 RepID=A0AAV7JBK6_9METZ|nr:Ubiquitin-conjugating enzyme [Oopsacas minuta]